IALAQNQKIDSLRQALSNLSKDDEKYVHTLWKAMNVNVQTDNRQAALYAGEAYAICQTRFHELRNQAGINFAERLVYIELLDSAESLLNEFYDSFSSSPSDSAALTRYYLTRGSIAHRRTKIKEAGDFYNSALKTALAIGDRKGTGLALLRLGSLYHRQRMDSLALEYYTQALPVYKDLKMESGMASIYSNLSTIYSYLGNYKYSDLYMDSALSIEERQGKVEGLISSYGNVVIDAVDRRKDFERAARYLEKLNNAVALTSAPRSLGFAANVTATYHLAISNFATARDAASIAYRIGRENKIRFILSNAYQNLVHANEGLRQFEDAYIYQKEWNAFKDSINQVEQENAIVELKTQYETEKKDAENQRLLHANEQQEKLNLILGGGGLLLLMLSGSLFYFYRGKQKANQKLVIQKRQIESNLNEKEALLREIHHRVKNNLQVISSLLNMQSYHLDDPGMINAIAEGQSRVKAMALIHQKLYQTEQLTEIDFEEYTNQLISHLATAFGQPDKKITSKVRGANIKLDIDTAIPLGLILNELVTNAYKYAFEGVNEGDLAIELQRVDDHQYKLTVADNGK
ncbi:MAG: histidine kinase dimerization/phosphoacceptor domain -containing protein, partial [Cyclobacteriaceae bacterium]